MAVLMQSAPGHIDVDEVRESIIELDDVIDVCDLRVWTGRRAVPNRCRRHVIVEDGRESRQLLLYMRDRVHDRFGIDHITIQLEPEGFEEPGLGY